MTNVDLSAIELPGLDCGLCGYRSCADMAAQLEAKPDLLKRCIPLAADFMGVQEAPAASGPAQPAVTPPVTASSAQPSLTIVNGESACAGCGVDCSPVESAVAVTAPGVQDAGTASEIAGAGVPDEVRVKVAARTHSEWKDHLGREFDFLLDHFPEEPGPREQIVPHNPLITRELEIQPGEILIGRPLGISCGCPITHCGIVQSVDMFTGAIVWCVTGPLHPRQHGFKDIGYYSAQAYEGLITKSRIEVEIGARYWFQPRMCMMQWRHSGLVNFLNRGEDGLQARIEGLWIG